MKNLLNNLINCKKYSEKLKVNIKKLKSIFEITLLILTFKLTYIKLFIIN